MIGDRLITSCMSLLDSSKSILGALIPHKAMWLVLVAAMRVAVEVVRRQAWPAAAASPADRCEAPHPNQATKTLLAPPPAPETSHSVSHWAHFLNAHQLTCACLLQAKRWRWWHPARLGQQQQQQQQLMVVAVLTCRASPVVMLDQPPPRHHPWAPRTRMHPVAAGVTCDIGRTRYPTVHPFGATHMLHKGTQLQPPLKHERKFNSSSLHTKQWQYTDVSQPTAHPAHSHLHDC